MNSRKNTTKKALAIILLFAITTSLKLFATNYYVSTDGDDNANGTSPETAWKTITHISDQTFSPGDTIFFKRGDVWRLPQDAALEVSSNGTAEAYIAYSSYGTGNKPRFLGSNQVTGWTHVSGNIWQASLAYNPMSIGYGGELFFENSDMSVEWGLNVGYDADFSNMTRDLVWAYNDGTVYVYSEVDPGTRFTSVEAPQAQRLFYLREHEYIAIDNIEFAYSTNIGIYDSYGSANIAGLRITNCHIHHIGHKDTGQGFGLSLKHSDMYIAHNDIHDCGRRNISLVTYNTDPAMHIENIIIEDNYLHDGWHTTGVDLNTIGAHTYDSIIIRNNLFQDPMDTDLSNEFSSKSLTSNQIFVAEQGEGQIGNVYIYNNVFYGHTGNGVLMEGVGPVYIYNNTFYGYNSTLTGYYGFVVASNTTGLDVTNNIFYDNGNPDTERDLYCVSINDSSTLAGATMDYNLYWEDYADSRMFMLQNVGGENSYYYYNREQWETYQSDMQIELNSPDPEKPAFFDPAYQDLRLKENSQARDAGIPVSFVNIDYQGVPRDMEAPSLGAYEFFISDSTATAIIRFTLPQQTGMAAVNAEEQAITIEVAYNTDLGNLTPEVLTSIGSTVNPASGVTLDFSEPQTYTVTSQDGTVQQEWTVHVSEQDAATGIQNPAKEAKLHIYPNPSTNIVHIETEPNAQIQITDVSGQTVYEQISYSGRITVHHHFQSGVYLIRVMGKEGVALKKLLVSE